MICHAVGLETGSASQDYIQIYEGDAKLLTESLEHIQKAASQILNAIGAEVPSRLPPRQRGLSPSRQGAPSRLNVASDGPSVLLEEPMYRETQEV